MTFVDHLKNVAYFCSHWQKESTGPFFTPFSVIIALP